MMEKTEALESMYRQVGDQAEAILQNGASKQPDTSKGDQISIKTQSKKLKMEIFYFITKYLKFLS